MELPNFDSAETTSKTSLLSRFKNFDSDLFRPIIATVEELCGKRYGTDPQADDYEVSR